MRQDIKQFTPKQATLSKRPLLPPRYKYKYASFAAKPDSTRSALPLLPCSSPTFAPDHGYSGSTRSKPVGDLSLWELNFVHPSNKTTEERLEPRLAFRSSLGEDDLSLCLYLGMSPVKQENASPPLMPLLANDPTTTNH